MDKSKKKLETEKYMVAFIDILGASDKIKNDSVGSLNTVHFVYEKALKLYKEQLLDERQSYIDPDRFEIIKTRIFSDNVVLYTRIGDDIKACFLHLTFLSAFMQAIFLNEGLLVRGGIAMGDFFADDIMLWGNALVNAYEIENNIAIYPRIVIQPSIIYSVDEEFASNCDCIDVDKDGCFYVDYLNRSTFSNVEKAIDKAKEICKKSLIESGYKTNKENVKVVQKLIWQQNYISHCGEKIKQEL